MFGRHQAKGIKILAWISYLLAVVGGAALANTVVGQLIGGIIGWFPPWVAQVGFAGGVTAMAVDLICDGIPNRLAVWMGILLPSLATSIEGKLGTTVTNISAQMLGQIDGGLRSWLGTSSALGIAACAVVISLLVARRVIHKGGR
jgi:hypothetical protein